MPIAALLALAALAVCARLQRSSVHPPPAGPFVAASAERPGDPVSIGGPRPEPSAVDAGPPRMVHGDSRHTHRANAHGPRALKVAWSVDVGGPVEAQVTASPDGQTLYVGTLEGSLLALSRADGATRWKLSLGERVYSAPCVGEDGTVYVGSDAKLFYAITKEGQIAWKLETGGDADTGAVQGLDKKIYFAAGNTVTAVRPGGDVAWRFTARGKIFTSPALTADGTILIGAQDHRVYALSPAGTQIWSVDLGADVDGAPTIGDDGAVFVGTDGDEVVRLGSRGEIVWRTKVGGFVRGPLSVTRNGDVLAGVYGPTPRQVRLVGQTGKVRGAFSIQGTGAREFGVHGGALEDQDGALYFGAQDDHVYAIDANGTLRFKLKTGGDVDAPLTMLPDGSLVAGSDDGKVYLMAP